MQRGVESYNERRHLTHVKVEGGGGKFVGVE